MSQECVVITPYDSNIKYKYSLKRLFYSNKMKNSLKFPYNYCIFPNTISSSKKPLKCFVLLKEVIYPGISIETYIVGGFKYIDSKGFFNHRILCVPHSNVEINDITDIPHFTLEEIKLFMLQYHHNKNEKIKFKGFIDKKEANEIYKDSSIRYNINKVIQEDRNMFSGLFKKIYKSSNNKRSQSFNKSISSRSLSN